MKPTKKQRHDIYVKLLEYFKNPENEWEKIKIGFCFVLNHCIKRNKPVSILDLPELMRYKPDRIPIDKVGDEYWFGRTEFGYFKRQFMLMAAIKDTETNT